MSKNQLMSLHVQNFRSLANVKINTDSLTVLFGPNGAGKSTFLEAIRLVRDCAAFGVKKALSQRNDGVGARWDGADEQAAISISLETENALYEIQFGYAQIIPIVREKLYSKEQDTLLIDREIGHHLETSYPVVTDSIVGWVERSETHQKYTNSILAEINNLLRGVRYYHARTANFHQLRELGSESNHGTQLNENCDNLWSVLRHLHEKRSVDKRYDTIMELMQESFPSFREMVFEQTTSNRVYAHFIEKGRRKPISAFGFADSYLQMLVHLTALFSEPDNTLVLLDEPEISLHPWALSVLADAVETATQKWQKQVLMATQSPVLISQFQPEYIFTVERDKTGQTVMTPVNEIEDIQDLLDDYATGSLYMAESIAPQSKRLEMPPVYESEGI